MLWKPPKFLFCLSFATHWWIFSCLHLWPAFRTNLFSGSLVAFVITLESHAAIGKPEQATWRGLLERFLQLVSDYRNKHMNLFFWIFWIHKKTAKNCENIQCQFQNVLFWFFRTFKKIFISWHFPFKLNLHKDKKIYNCLTLVQAIAAT